MNQSLDDVQVDDTNKQQPVKDMQRKAEAGDAAAQYQLGMAYYDGAGLPEDKTEAVKWLRKTC